MKPFQVVLITLLSAIVLGSAIYFGYKYFVDDKVEATVEQVLTPEEATASFSAEKNEFTVTQIYYELPAETYFLIVQKIGTAATKQQVVTEYLNNRESYISAQVAEKIKEVSITGPDSANVKNVQVGVQLKEETPPVTPVVPIQSDQKIK
mgnify:CR=1 FL=1